MDSLLSALPPSIKLQVLMSLGDDTLKRTLAAQSDDENLLPPIRFCSNFNPVKNQRGRFFAYEDLLKIDEQGFLIKDHFIDDKHVVASLYTEVSKKYYWISAQQSRWLSLIPPPEHPDGETHGRRMSQTCWHEQWIQQVDRFFNPGRPAHVASFNRGFFLFQ